MSFELISSELRKARTQHRCIWCGQQIIKGETYRHERCTVYGEFQVQDWHDECEKAFVEELRESDETFMEFEPWANARPVHNAPTSPVK